MPCRTGWIVACGPVHGPLRTNLCELTFEHLTAYLDDIITVTEDEIAAAVAALAGNAHLVVEPSGAVAVAGYLGYGGGSMTGKAAAVLSGGNVDPVWFAETLLRTTS